MEDERSLVRFCKALSDPTRLRLAQLLSAQGEDRALCVGALAHRLGVTPAAVSQHLAVLRAAGLVIDERRGYFVHYRLRRERVAADLEGLQSTLVEGAGAPGGCHDGRPSSGQYPHGAQNDR